MYACYVFRICVWIWDYGKYYVSFLLSYLLGRYICIIVETDMASYSAKKIQNIQQTTVPMQLAPTLLTSAPPSLAPSVSLGFGARTSGADLANFGATDLWRRKLDDHGDISSYQFGAVASGAAVLKFGSFTLGRRKSGV
jgi:hypothetical protein